MWEADCQCVHYACVVLNVCAACSGLGDTHQPIRRETTYLWFYQQLRFTEHKPTSTSIFAFVGGLSKCSFSIGFFKAAHIGQWILFEQFVSSTMKCVLREFQRQLQKYQKNRWISVKCWNVRPSCSSRHVECTKTWMRDLSSVLWEDRTLSLKLDSQPTLVLP